MTDIVIDAQPIEPFDVKLVGKSYEITPPKAALAMRLAVEAKLYSDEPEKMVEILNVWIRKAFKEKAEKVLARLDDEDDDLDILHIMALMEKVMEKQTENPTS